MMGRATLPVFPIKIAISLSLLAVVIGLVSPADLLEAWGSLDSRYLTAAAILMPLGLGLQWWKWRVLLRCVTPEVEEADVARSLFAGFGLGLLTPGRLGELGRGIVLPGLRGAATRLTLLDRLLSALVTLAAGAVSAVVLMPDVGTLGLAVAGILLATVAWLVRGTGTRQVQGLAAPRVPLRGWLANLAAATLFNIVFFIQMSLLVGAGGELSTAVLWAVPAVFAIKTLLPISFLDLGVREAAAVGVLSLVGVTPAVALQASLILFALNVLVPGALGLLVLEREAVTRLAPRLAHVR